MVSHDPFRIALRAHRADYVAIDSSTYGRFTYSELVLLCDGHLSSLLGSLESSIAILADEGPLVPVAELAVALMGGCFVPLDPTMPRERVLYQMQDSCCRVVVTTKEAMPNWLQAKNVRPEDVTVVLVLGRKMELDLDESFVFSSCGWISLAEALAEKIETYRFRSTDQLGNVSNRLDLLPQSPADESTASLQEALEALNSLFTNALSTTSASSATLPPRALYVVYTSGTTGRPKGVLGYREALLSYLSLPLIRKAPEERVLLCSAVTWDPSISDIFATFLYGATLILEPRARLMSRLSECVELNAVSHVLATPALWKMVFGGGSGGDRETMPTLRRLLLGGEAWTVSEIFVPAGVVELFNVYGVTECTIYQAATANLISEENYLLKPLCSDAVKLRIADNGELLIGGALPLSYLCSDDLNREKFFKHEDGERYFRTGDRVNGEKGGFQILGRMDRQVKLNGFRIELDEVETLTMQAPLVELAACLLVGPGDCEKRFPLPRLICFVQRTDDYSLHWEMTGIALRFFCEAKMPKFQIPHNFVLRKELPLTTSGKIDRVTLLKSWLSSESNCLQETHYVTPAKGGARPAVGTEQRLATIWAEVLGVAEDQISARTHFFERGGGSLQAVEMVHKLAKYDDADSRHAKLCWLINRPRLRDYASWLDGLSGPANGVCENGFEAKTRKKKIKRKRRDLNSGLNRHTLSMFQRHIHSTPEWKEYGSIHQPLSDEEEGLSDDEAYLERMCPDGLRRFLAEQESSTEAEALRAALRCGDRRVVDTIEAAMKY